MTIKASAADTGGGYTLLDCTWPANVGTPLHVHYEEDEGFYVLEGSVSITVGDDVVELKAGEHAFGPRGIPHRFDVGPEGARMVWVLTPGRLRGLRRGGERPGTGAHHGAAGDPAAGGHRGDRPPPRHGAALSQRGGALRGAPL